MDQSKLDNQRFFPNNRVNMYYLGAQGKVGRSLGLTLKVSYSKNFGTPGADFDPPRGQFSSVLGAQYAVPGLKNASIIARIATDQGEIFKRRTGGYIGFRKDW
ncbi:hypothetical protein D3C87_1878170 [compost metagenome]